MGLRKVPHVNAGQVLPEAMFSLTFLVLQSGLAYSSLNSW